MNKRMCTISLDFDETTSFTKKQCIIINNSASLIKDIDIVLNHCNSPTITRVQVVNALNVNDWDVVNAIMYLTT